MDLWNLKCLLEIYFCWVSAIIFGKITNPSFSHRSLWSFFSYQIPHILYIQIHIHQFFLISSNTIHTHPLIFLILKNSFHVFIQYIQQIFIELLCSRPLSGHWVYSSEENSTKLDLSEAYSLVGTDKQQGEWAKYIICCPKIISDVVKNEAGKEERKFRLEGWVRVFQLRIGQSADASLWRWYLTLLWYHNLPNYPIFEGLLWSPLSTICWQIELVQSGQYGFHLFPFLCSWHHCF